MYGLACGDYLHAPYPHCGLAGANSPLQWVQLLMDGWLALPNMTPDHFILVLPAVGFWFDCIGDNSLHCPMNMDNRISYHRATALLAAVTANGSLTGPTLIDNETATSVFNWKHGDTVQQVWVDTGDTIGTKVAWARQAGFKGVGLYQGTGAYPDNATGTTEPLYSAIFERFIGRGRLDGRHPVIKTDDTAEVSAAAPVAGRFEHCAWTKGGIMYVLGGQQCCQNNKAICAPLSSQLMAFTPGTADWRTLHPKNPPAASGSIIGGGPAGFTCTLVGNDVYVIGRGIGGAAAGGSHILNTKAMMWRKGPVLPADAPHTGHKTALITTPGSQQLYVFGGQNQRVNKSVTFNAVNTLFALDVVTPGAQWHKISTTGSLPPPRLIPTFTAGVHKGQPACFLFGGMQWGPAPQTSVHAAAHTGQEVNLNDMYVLDTTSHVWTRISSHNTPTPRHGHTDVWLQDESTGKLLITGGTAWNTSRRDCLTTFNASCYYHTNRTWLFSPATETWEELACKGKPWVSAPHARDAHTTVAVVDGKLLDYGGFCGTATGWGSKGFPWPTCSSGVYQLDVAGAQWTRVGGLFGESQ